MQAEPGAQSLLNASAPEKSPHEHLLAVCLAATPGMTPGQVARESVALEEPEHVVFHAYVESSSMPSASLS